MSTATLPRISIRDGDPAIEVRDTTLYWRDPRSAAACEQLGEERVDRVYVAAQYGFWDWAAEVAKEHGFGDVSAAGRSGGWLTVSGPFLEYLDADDPWTDAPELDPDPVFSHDDYIGQAVRERDRFLEFAAAIEELRLQCIEGFIDELCYHAADESHITRGTE